MLGTAYLLLIRDFFVCHLSRLGQISKLTLLLFVFVHIQHARTAKAATVEG